VTRPASGQLTPTQWKLLMLFGSFSPRRLGWRSPRSFLRESYSGLRDGIDRCVRSHSGCYGWRTHHFKACFHKARSHQCPHQEDRREQAYDGEETSVAWTLAAASGRLFISVHDPHSTKMFEGQHFRSFQVPTAIPGPMSQMGQKRRFGDVRVTSILHPKADLHRKDRHVSNLHKPGSR
jgi:hypothetical protein